MKVKHWLKVRINGRDTKAGVSEANMGSPLLSAIIEQAFWKRGLSTFRWSEWEVYDSEGNRLQDGYMHLRTDIATGDTIEVSKPIGFGA